MKHIPKTVVIDWLNTIWETDLPYQCKYLACYLRKFMNSQHDMAWPSYSRIVSETGLSKSTVIRYLAYLEEEQWLTRDRGSKGKNTIYTACFPTSVTQTLPSNDQLVSHRHQGSVTQTPTSVTLTPELNKELNNQSNNTNKTLDQNKFDPLFDQFWNSGIRRVGKKKARPLFERLARKHKHSPEAFAHELVRDIQERLRINQLGFDSMHPTTYLNGERWSDEIKTTQSIRKSMQSPMASLTDTSWADHLLEGDI